MMSLADVARVLAVAQSYDNRKVDEVVVESWHRVLGHLEYDDALTAVHRHYATSRDWMMPIDVIDGSKLIRRERLEAVEKYTPDADPDDIPAYLEARRIGRVRTDEQLEQRDMRAIEGTFPDPPRSTASPAAIEQAKAVTPPSSLGSLKRGMTRIKAFDDERMAQARAELAARQPVPTPDEVTT
jgi:hypothetical protein